MGLEELNVSFNSCAALTALHFHTKEGKQRKEGKYMTRQLKYITFWKKNPLEPMRIPGKNVCPYHLANMFFFPQRKHAHKGSMPMAIFFLQLFRDLHIQWKHLICFLPDQQFYPGLWFPGRWVCDHWGTQEDGERRWLKLCTHLMNSFKKHTIHFNLLKAWFPGFDISIYQHNEVILSS